MQHVQAIENMIEGQQYDEAYEAIERLLYFGNSNTAALHLKAKFLRQRGEFDEASKIIERILEVTPDDPEAIEQIVNQKLEQKEFFYFTDKLDSGGRRYLAYPRKLTMTAVYGLFGSLGFFVMNTLMAEHEYLQDDRLMFLFFGLMVLAPWVSLVVLLCRGVKSICIEATGITIEKRFRSRLYSWDSIDSVTAIPQNFQEDGYGFRVRFKLKEDAKGFFMDLTQSSSSMKSRMYLIRHLVKYYPAISFKSLISLDKNESQWPTY